jgi:serine/threonine protein kinase
LEYLHAQGIVHRDVKAENVVIGTNGVARVRDFGMAEHVGQVSSLGIGSLPYLAPELFAGEVDISVGLM